MPIFLARIAEKNLQPCWEPPADVYNTPLGWTIKMELAGVDPNDIAIELSGKILSVSGIRRDSMVQVGWSHQSLEISYCHFQREFHLPTQGAVFISTEYRSGMLLIHIAREGNVL